jgi:hypothetical protein
MNRALKVARTPSVVIALLQALHDASLPQNFRGMGTHALYAYGISA